MLEFLLAKPERAADAARRIESDAGWAGAVELASHWGVLPRLAQRLEQHAITPPDAVRVRLRQWTRAAFVRSASALHHGVQALSALAEARIDAAAIKGVASIATVYRGPQDRSIGDVDLLVRRVDLEAAVTRLFATGIRSRDDRSLDEQVRLARKFAHDGNRAVDLIAPDGSLIDLHWQIGRPDVDTILRGAQTVALYGSTIRVANPSHGFLLAAYNALRNGFVSDRASRDLLDADALLERVVAAGNLATTVQTAAHWGLATPALASLTVLADLAPSSARTDLIATFDEACTADERRQAADLARLFLDTNLDARAHQDLMRLLYPEVLWQTLKRMMTGQSEYPWLMRNGVAERRGSRTIGQRLKNLGYALRSADWQRLRSFRDARKRAAR